MNSSKQNKNVQEEKEKNEEDDESLYSISLARLLLAKLYSDIILCSFFVVRSSLLKKMKDSVIRDERNAN